jgi:hypothetical protein
MQFIYRKLAGIELMPEVIKEGVNAQFVPPQEQLAYNPQLPEEADFQAILAEPLQIIVEALQAQETWDDMLRNLPDIALEPAKNYGLVTDDGYAPAS